MIPHAESEILVRAPVTTCIGHVFEPILLIRKPKYRDQTTPMLPVCEGNGVLCLGFVPGCRA